MVGIGTVLNNQYRIDRIIGTGGTGIVYEAYDLSMKKVVAVKMLKDEFAENAEYRRRFSREATAGLTLKHENIVASLAVGEFENRNYIVFEYINGSTLKEYITKNSTLSSRVAVNITCQILRALKVAHDAGIVHRDVKPQNVMLSANGKVKLADFGIARIAPVSTKTFDGKKLLGSVHYMSPEQVQGNTASTRSDLYSVGIILYEMLTGQLPFDGESEISIAINHCAMEMEEPKSVNDNISTALNYVILKSTAKDPEARYSNAEQMRQDLLRALREPNSAFAKLPPLSDKENVNKTPNRSINRVGLGLLIGLGCLFLLFIIVTTIYNAQHIPIPNIVGKSFDSAKDIISDDFEIVISSSATSDKYPAGYIISQEPSGGTRAASGVKIRVVVSIDKNNAIVPNLSGMSLLEANNALVSAGLLIEAVEYDETSDATTGTVFSQTPKANEEVKRSSAVKLYISGKPTETAKMPSVTNCTIENAANSLLNFGFKHIIVRYANISGTTPDVVTAQNISPGLEIDKSTTIHLTVYGQLFNAYAEDKAFNLSISSNDTPVMATLLLSAGYEVVIYETVMPSGTQVASFRACAPDAGTYECIIYANGVEQKRESVNFAHGG